MTTPSWLREALLAPQAGPALRAADTAGLLADAIPELEAGRAFVQPQLHAFTVLEHQLATVEAFDAATGGDEERSNRLRRVLAWFDLDGTLAQRVEGWTVCALARLACLVHDVAKPATAAFSEGRLRFPRHGPTGADMMEARLPALGFGPEATDMVCRLVRLHLRPAELVRKRPPSERALRRFVADTGGHVAPLMLLNLADGWATRGPGYTDEHFDRHCLFVNYVLALCHDATQRREAPLIHGEDLMAELGLSSGRLLGAVLLSVRRAQEERRIMTREDALSLARTVLASMETGQDDDASSDAQG